LSWSRTIDDLFDNAFSSSLRGEPERRRFFAILDEKQRAHPEPSRPKSA
jgi:hypothetical protein